MSGCLPSGWSKLRLSDVAELQLGKMLNKAKNVAGQSMPYLRNVNVRWGAIETSDLYNMRFTEAEAARFSIHDGDVLVCEGGEPGRCAIWKGGPTNLKFQKAIHRIRTFANVLPEWVALFLRHEALQDGLADHFTGTTIKHLPAQALAALRLPIPPLAEQRRIVRRIEALFARTHRARADLERIAPLSDRHRLATLRAAVTGQLTESWRQSHPKLEDVRDLLRRVPSPQQGRGGREATSEVIPGAAGLSINDPGTLVPTGWAWTPLLRVARQESGHTPSRRVPAYWESGNVPWVGIRDAGAHHGATIHDTIQKCTPLGIENSSARLLPAGTVCLSRTASVGYVTILGKPMATSQDFATWTCTKALLPEYLMFALLAEGDDIRRFGEGSTHTTIYFPEIRALHICLPPVDEQAEIVRPLTANAGGQSIASAEATRTLALLDGLEQSILIRAFRGKLVSQYPEGEAELPLLSDTEAPPRARRRRAA